MNYTKENAVEKYCELIVSSWTWERLTAKEAQAWTDYIYSVNIMGTAKQRYAQTAELYRAFLTGCGYDGPFWRDPEPSTF